MFVKIGAAQDNLILNCIYFMSAFLSSSNMLQQINVTTCNGCNGQVVSFLSFYSEDESSSSTEVSNFYCLQVAC